VGGAAAAVRALVTGGGGFLGAAVVRRLVARGDTVRSLTRGAYPELDALGVETVRGDVADPAVVGRAVVGCDVVFHIAAKAGIWGSDADYRRTNVDGTRAVAEACREHGVGRLVFTSTPSVVHAGRDIAGGDESLPYATRFSSPYPATKAVAERMVLAANSPALATVALRPHLIWGPGDTQLVPRILDLARRGRLRLVDGGRALVDSTYIDDAAAAHLLAADRLAAGSAVAGRAYFISAGEPRPVRELVHGFLAAGGLAPMSTSLPFPVAYGLGAGLEAAYRLLGRADEPPLTRFLARQLATAHWFDITAARRDLGYAPQVSIAEGLRRLRCHLAATHHADLPAPLGE
jgi:nucleoside-diphosphate-sugar epimerase